MSIHISVNIIIHSNVFKARNSCRLGVIFTRVRFFFRYQKNSNKPLKPVFEYKSPFEFVFVLSVFNIHRGYFVPSQKADIKCWY